MLKSYEGDIYNNTFVLIISGIIAMFLAYYLICKSHPTIALCITFMIMLFSSGLVYPSMGYLNSMFPKIASIDNMAMGVLSLA